MLLGLRERKKLQRERQRDVYDEEKKGKEDDFFRNKEKGVSLTDHLFRQHR